MIDIDRVIKAIVEAESERAGCSDGERKQINRWIKLAHSDNPTDHDKLIKEIGEHCY